VPPVRGNGPGRQFFLQASVLAYFINPLSMPCLLLAGCVYRGLLPKEGLHSPMVENPSKMSVRKKPYPNGCHQVVSVIICNSPECEPCHVRCCMPCRCWMHGHGQQSSAGFAAQGLRRCNVADSAESWRSSSPGQPDQDCSQNSIDVLVCD
jgi:hypothetical protein